MPYLPVTYKYTESLSETERGAAGFGSTGSK
jgi:dUTPase